MVGEAVSHYRILEELGHGGMGVVYKALDATLDRPVALKFLPRYLTADGGEKERFYHEARAAAAINHPNVTTIYEIGEHEGQLFLAMEFVEGETLKSFLGRSAPATTQLLDIALQIAQALSSAHEHGVIHRDIKPDNIMITPKGAVKVADFGLAKLIGATRLTKAGSTLGTVAYMSPEQARGEEVDHRTDIFSFGVVLYELFTGRPPFRGDHEAALLYALMNEDPAPIARYNNDADPEIERIVGKALAKDTAERYQHMDDMIADLRRVLRRTDSLRATASVRQTESPPLGSALPPVPPPVAPAPPAGRSVHPSRAKAIVRYAVPAGVFLAALLLLMVFNPFNFQLNVQQGNAAEKGTSLAVLYFQNISDPEDRDHTGDMLTELLTTALSQDKGLQVVSRERLYEIQKNLGEGNVKTFPPSLAQKLAERAGVSMMLLGSVLQREPSLAVTVRVVDVKSGNIISSQRLSGFPAKQVFTLVDTLAMLVSNDVAPRRSPSPPAETKSIAEVTTSSPEAYRFYLEGVDNARKFLGGDARAALNRAIDLDSNFAMAYFALGGQNIATDPLSMKPHLQKAWDLRAHVTERERMQIEAEYFDVVLGKTEESAGVLEKFIEKYPFEVQAYARLATKYHKLSRYDKALLTYQRLVQRDSLAKDTWNDIAYLYAGFGRREEALSAVGRYMGLAPGEPNPFDSKGEIFLIFGEMDSAVACFQHALKIRSDFLSAEKMGWKMTLDQNYDAAREYFQRLGSTPDREQRSQARLDEVMIPMHQGKLRYARQFLSGIQAELQRDRLTSWAVIALQMSIILDQELGDYPAMLRHARQLWHMEKDFPATLLGGQELLAEALQAAGDAGAKEKMVERMAQEVQGRPAFAQRRYQYALARIAFVEGSYDRALEYFRSFFAVGYPQHAPQLPYGVALLKTGNLAEAVSELKRATWWVPISSPPIGMSNLPHWTEWPIAAVKAHYWLGVAYEQQERREDAVRELARFLEIWKNADFPSPEMKDAGARLARLQGRAAK